MPAIYEPREDSFLMQDQVRKLARGTVLDMGTGSGIQAEAALERPEVDWVYAVDRNVTAVNHCKKIIRNRKLKCLKSDLFSAFKRGRLKKLKFDTIIFNPPYLPSDGKKKDIALIGGKKGYETVQKFLEQASDFLADDGIILLLFSSLTNRHRIDEIIKQNGFESEQIMKSRQFFEELFVYRIWKSRALHMLEKFGFKDISYFSEGVRGTIYTALLKGKKVAVKVKKPESHAIGRVENEGKILAIVNKKGIGPKLLKAEKDFVVYEFVEGVHLRDWLQKSPKSKVKKIIMQLLEQAFELDKLGISKEEMHRPLKNALVTRNNKLVLLDFERTRPSEHPRNVTQVCQFIWVWRTRLKKAGISISEKKIRALAKSYKDNPSEQTFKAILGSL